MVGGYTAELLNGVRVRVSNDNNDNQSAACTY